MAQEKEIFNEGTDFTILVYTKFGGIFHPDHTVGIWRASGLEFNSYSKIHYLSKWLG